MDNSTTDSVRKVFGTNFQQYCAHHKILLKEEKCGAFMVSNATVLRECIDILDGYKLRVHNRLNEIQRCRSPSNLLNNKRLYKQHKTDQKKRQKFYKTAKNESFKSFLDNLNLRIYLYDTSSFLPSYTVHTISDNYILNTAKTGSEIYEFIIQKTMKDTIIADYEDSIQSVSSFLEQFRKQHKRFHYASVLKHLIQKQEMHTKLKCEYEVTTKQLKSFIDLIFAKVVPLNLFGKLKNLKKIKKAMFHLLNVPHYKSFNLMSLIMSLDVSSITWLQNIKSRRVQWLVVAKFVKWFFTGFLIKILRIHFHVTSFSATNNERLYIMRSNWCYIQKKFIKKRIHSNILQPYIQCSEWNPPIGIYKLYSKYSGVRPIFISQYQINEKNDINIIFKFLKQLYITEYGSTTFQEKWKSIVQQTQNSPNKKLYLVSCDVIDAFGSIIQGQLYNIILSLCEKLPQSLELKYYWVKSKNCTDSDILCCKQYFSDPLLQLPFPHGTLYACRNHEIQHVQKSWLMAKIWKYIFSQRVKVHKKTYVVGKGIVQGTMLSPILSNIYFSFILHNHMSQFFKSGEVIRYMDDILYATENIIVAKEFLQLTRKGIPQYNCYFKELKTQSNFSCNENSISNTITFIGYQINCNTLEVEPKYSNTDVRYLISYSSTNNLGPLGLLKKRLNAMAYLKLSKLVLDNSINSNATIIKLLQDTCLLQAKRAYTLIKDLFHNVQTNVRSIYKVIKSSNKKIAKHIIKILLTLDEKMSELEVRKWNKEILCILINSYKQIFKRDKILNKNFINIYLK